MWPVLGVHPLNTVEDSYGVRVITLRCSNGYLAPGRATPKFGYGYLLWLLPGNRRQFALIGLKGQRICIDPGSKLVMVQTAHEDTDEVWPLWSALLEQFG
jgi:hypothetical protein